MSCVQKTGLRKIARETTGFVVELTAGFEHVRACIDALEAQLVLPRHPGHLHTKGRLFGHQAIDNVADLCRQAEEW